MTRKCVAVPHWPESPLGYFKLFIGGRAINVDMNVGSDDVQDAPVCTDKVDRQYTALCTCDYCMQT